MEFNNIQEYSDYFEQVKEITNNYFDKYKSELKIPENFEGSFRNAFQHAFGTVIIVSRVQFFAPNLVKLRNLFII